jgi:hypothetical protein
MHLPNVTFGGDRHRIVSERGTHVPLPGQGASRDNLI